MGPAGDRGYDQVEDSTRAINLSLAHSATRTLADLDTHKLAPASRGPQSPHTHRRPCSHTLTILIFPCFPALSVRGDSSQNSGPEGQMSVQRASCRLKRVPQKDRVKF